MSDNTTSQVGRAAIDAYLDLVEAAMLEAHAPRSDRAQVLADLESQISDMLAREPQPLTEEVVKGVIDRLESPYHFAAMYGNGNGNGKQAERAESPRVGSYVRSAIPRGIRWSRIAAACLAVAVSAGIMLLLAAVVLRPFVGPGHRNLGMLVQLIMQISLFFGFIATPFALAMSYRQLLARPGAAGERNLVVKMLVAFAILAPAMVITVLAEWTYGIVLVPFGIFGFIYLQAKVVRRFQRHLNEKLPPQGDDAGVRETPPREPGPAMGGGMAMAGV